MGCFYWVARAASSAPKVLAGDMPLFRESPPVCRSGMVEICDRGRHHQSTAAWAVSEFSAWCSGQT